MKALLSPKTTSSLVADTILALKQLSVFNSVRLLWVPGYSGVDGNETAVLLAKQAAHSEFVGPEPAVRISALTVRTEVREWANKEHLMHWQTTCM